MSALAVMDGPCRIEDGQRRMLFEIDLSALKAFPPGFTLERCVFLRFVRLPVELELIPSDMFDTCQYLEFVNVGECAKLREIRESAFGHCWKLRHLDVPAQCKVVCVDESGLLTLDLRFVRPSVITAFYCARLSRVIVPHAFRGKLNLEAALSLVSLTVGDVSGDGGCFSRSGVSLLEFRYVGASFADEGGKAAGLLSARVFGEVSAVSASISVPSLPG
jgi:hypothetical protein